MKTSLAVVAAAVLAAFSIAGAQPPPGPHGGHHEMLSDLTSSLNLTADQQAKIQPDR